MPKKTEPKKTPKPTKTLVSSARRTAKHSLPDRSKTYVRESRALSGSLDQCVDALGLTKAALYTLAVTDLLNRMLPVLAAGGVDRAALQATLRTEFEAALNAAA